jgi:hypothetical protein
LSRKLRTFTREELMLALDRDVCDSLNPNPPMRRVES